MVLYHAIKERDKAGVAAGNNHTTSYITPSLRLSFFIQYGKCKKDVGMGLCMIVTLLLPLSCPSPFWHGTVPTSYFIFYTCILYMYMYMYISFVYMYIVCDIVLLYPA